jgi:hypothetical protein
MMSSDRKRKETEGSRLSVNVNIEEKKPDN